MFRKIPLLIGFLLYFGAISAQNSALEFDGINDNVTISPISAYNFGSGDFSVEATIKMDSYSAPGAFVTAMKDNSCSSQLEKGWALLPQPDGRVYFYIGDGNKRLCNTIEGVGSSVLNINQCYHLAGVKENGVIKLYVDGILVDSKPTGMVLTGNIPVLIGLRYANIPNLYFHDGTIQEVRIWNRARNVAEIRSSMNISLVGNELGLVGYWPLNDGTGSSTAIDKTSFSNNGTLVNMNATTTWVLPCGTVLESNMLALDAKVIDDQIQVLWQYTGLEEIKAGILLQKLQQGGIDTIHLFSPGEMLTQGYTHRNTTNGQTAYQLVMKTVSGKTVVSNWESLWVDKSPVLFYPNPVSDFLFINSSHTISVQVYDRLGRKLNFSQIEKEGDIWKIDLRMLPHDTYFLRWDNGVDFGTEKVVK